MLCLYIYSPNSNTLCCLLTYTIDQEPIELSTTISFSSYHNYIGKLVKRNILIPFTLNIMYPVTLFLFSTTLSVHLLTEVMPNVIMSRF